MSKTVPTPNGADAKPAPGSEGKTPYSFLLPAIEPDEIGRVGHYRVLHLLGSGGMGMVFAAEDMALQRHVAIKVMHPELASDPNGGWQRFLREARALGGVKHHHLVTVYQAFQDRGTVFLVMELLHGESLEARIRRPEPLTIPEILRIGKEIATGLAALHGHGLIHRDIKPANIWLETVSAKRTAASKSGVLRGKEVAPFHVKILDLGLVRPVEDDDGLTASGMVMGTPAYMSLEQVRGLALDHRTDLFSLGCVLYAACTGRPPFDGDNPVAQATALIRGRLRPVIAVNPTIPKLLSDLISTLLAKEPKDRPESALDVVELIEEIGKSSQIVIGESVPAPNAPNEPRTPVSSPKTEALPKSGPRADKLRKTTAKTQTANVVDLDPNQDPGKSSRRSKRKKKTFLKKHGLTLLAVFWLLVAVLLVVSVLGQLDKSNSNDTTPDPTTPTPTQPSAKPTETLPKLVYLSEFPAARTVNGPAMPSPPNFDGTIRVDGRLAQHGIFMHAAPPDTPPARITYKLNKEVARFTAEVGYNYTAPPNAPAVRFQVYCDGQNKWSSGPLPRHSPAVACDLDVKGVTELTLEVTSEGGERGAHGAWLDPRVTK